MASPPSSRTTNVLSSTIETNPVGLAIEIVGSCGLNWILWSEQKGFLCRYDSNFQYLEVLLVFQFAIL